MERVVLEARERFFLATAWASELASLQMQVPHARSNQN